MLRPLFGGGNVLCYYVIYFTLQKNELLEQRCWESRCWIFARSKGNTFPASILRVRAAEDILS